MKVKLYTKSNCTYCTQAKALLDKHNIEYELYKLQELSSESGENIVTREELLTLFPNATTMPQISIDGISIGGFTQLKAYLN